MPISAASPVTCTSCTRLAASVHPNGVGTRVRIALLGSFYRGYYLLDELLHGPHRHRFEVVGVATDDVSSNHIHHDKRVWSYPHAPWEERMVEALATQHGLALFNGRVDEPPFVEQFCEAWAPDVGVSATYGQRIVPAIFNRPSMGFFNVHPCNDQGWPSRYAGPNPFQGLIDDGEDYTMAALHRVNEHFDQGSLVALSDRIALPRGAGVVDMHKLTSPVIGKFVVNELVHMLDRARSGTTI